MKLLRIGFLLLCAALAACDETPEPAHAPVPPAATLPGVYAGDFPCANCPGIATTLWLRRDGRYILEQNFPADEASGAAPETAHALGRWALREEGRVLALTGEGPERLFERPEADRLLMRSSSPLEHRLERSRGAPEFGNTIRLRGMARPRGEGYVFRECLTGYELPLAKGGDYKRFTRQFRSVVPRGEAVRAEIDARFTWAADGTPQALTILHFVTLRNDGAC